MICRLESGDLCAFKEGNGRRKTCLLPPQDVHLHGHLWFSAAVHELFLAFVTKPSSQWGGGGQTNRSKEGFVELQRKQFLKSHRNYHSAKSIGLVTFQMLESLS